jgi:hypothetical protein
MPFLSTLAPRRALPLLALLAAGCAEQAPVSPAVGDRAPAGAFPRFTAAGALADPATPGVRRDAAPGAKPAGLLWQNLRSGRRVRWTLNSDATYAGTFAELRQVATYYRIEAEADFNGDGSPDVVWKNTGTGSRSIWLMTGAYWSGSASLPNPGKAWDVAGAADFDRDGKPDLVLRNHDTGEVRIHRMDGTTWTATEWVLPTQPAGYRIVGAGDFDGDGNPDLVWEDPSTGAHWLWLMDGTAWNGRRADIWTAPTYWSVEAVGDANGDGKPDLAWANSGTGERVIWLMDGVAWHGAYAALPTVPTEWKMAAIAPIPITAPLPTVSTVTASQDTTATTMTATVNPHGLPAIWWFEYRVAGSNAEFTATPARTLDPQDAAVQVSETRYAHYYNAAPDDLIPGRSYEYRCVITNAAGTARSALGGFTVAPDSGSGTVTVTTGDASVQNTDAAIVHGTVEPHGRSVTVWVEWGTNPDLSGASETYHGTLRTQTGTVPLFTEIQPLVRGTRYYYRVAADDGSGGVVRGSIASFLFDQPAAPVATGSFVVPGYYVQLTWQDGAGGGPVSYYSSPNSLRINGHTAVDSSVAVDSARTLPYTVQACNPLGCTYSAWVYVTTQRLEPPSNLTATPLGSGRVQLNWQDNSVGESWFTVQYRGTQPTDTWQTLATTAPDATSYTATGLVWNATYQFRVIAAVIGSDPYIHPGIRNSVPSPVVQVFVQ